MNDDDRQEEEEEEEEEEGRRTSTSTSSFLTRTLIERGPLAFPAFTLARRRRATIVANMLRSGQVVSDEAFDEIYPDVVRRVSAFHWTPIRVCARVVALLGLKPHTRVLDIGAGVGKFCIVASAMSGGAKIRGIEKRSRLADTAREAARRLGVKVEIATDRFGYVDARQIDAVYLFNPFAEEILLPGLGEESNDTTTPTDEDIITTQYFLSSARIGTRAVTYCGFGGEVPPSYARLAVENWNGGCLELWEKHR